MSLDTTAEFTMDVLHHQRIKKDAKADHWGHTMNAWGNWKQSPPMSVLNILA